MSGGSGGGGGSSASGYPAQRVGKRIRRKPQWLDVESTTMSGAAGGGSAGGGGGGGRGRGNKASSNANNNNNNSNSNTNYDDQNSTRSKGGGGGNNKGSSMSIGTVPHAVRAGGSSGGGGVGSSAVGGGGGATGGNSIGNMAHMNNNLNATTGGTNDGIISNGLGVPPPSMPITDSASTVSLKSTDSSGETPVIDDPVFDMWRAVTICQEQHTNRRDIVDAFHTWQKSAVSKQAAQQKALHVHLKRRLRKRTTKMPDMDRAEEEALRNARRGLEEDHVEGDHQDEKRHAATRRKTNELIEENSLHGNTIVPSKVRLPLEAYLPRRVRPARDIPPVDDLLSIVPDPPRLQSALKSQGKAWLTLPTVNPSSEWNSRKSSGHKRPLDNVEQEQEEQ